MRAFLFLAAFILATSSQAEDICSPAAKSILKAMGTDLAKLDKHCARNLKSPTSGNVKLYDISSGKNDFAEVTDDLHTGSGIGAQIKFSLSASMMGKFCITGIMIDGKSTLSCTANPGSTSVAIYSKNKDLRIDLMKNRDMSETKIVTGVIIGFDPKILIELN